MGKREQGIIDGMWEMPQPEIVQEAAGMQLVMTYIGRHQETVAQWVELRLIFELCARERVYKGFGCGR